jgi:hypothetical protein
MCNFTRAVSIKLLENRFKFLIIKVTWHIHSCRQEFSVIDFVVGSIIYFIDNLLKLSLRHVHIFLLNRVLKLSSGDHSRTIFINSSKLFAQICHLFWCCHFHKHIHACFLEHRFSLIINESVDGVIAESLFFVFSWIKDLEPLVLKTLESIESFWLTHNKHVLNQVFAVAWNAVEFWVVEVEVSWSDFAEYFLVVVTLEW